METKKIKLLSGVDCEITKFKGKHQRYFTQEEYKKDGKGVNLAISDIIVKLGSKNGVTEEEAEKMLSGDRKKIMIQARIFSLKRHKTFKFDYKYENEDGKMVTESMELDVDANDFETIPYKQQFSEYDEIWELIKSRKWGNITLEDSKLEVFFLPIDGTAENKIHNTSKKTRSSHTLINAHVPVYLHKKKSDKEGALINVNLDNLSMDDIEDLRVAIKAEEGFQETKAIFENPETMIDEEVDVLGIAAFFFPSNAM